MKRAGATWALLLASSVAALGIAEAVVRALAPQDARIQTPGIYRRDSATVYSLTIDHMGVISNRVEYQNVVRTDARGLRIPATGPRSDRPRRILVLGDSFVFGQGVEAEDAMPLQIERALEERGDSVSVLNAGVVGYATRQQLAWLERYGTALAPELVIVGAFLGNDLQDNRTSALERFSRGVVSAPPKRWHSPVTEWAYRNLHVYALARRLPVALNDRRAGLNAMATGYIRKYRPPDDGVYREEVTITAAALDSIARVAGRIGAHVLVVLIPEAVQVEQSRQALLRRWFPDTVRLDLDHPNRVFRRLLDSLRLPAIDLTPAFRAAARDGVALYYPVDAHWTAAGNALAGGLVADAVLRSRPSSSNPALRRPD